MIGNQLAEAITDSSCEGLYVTHSILKFCQLLDNNLADENVQINAVIMYTGIFFQVFNRSFSLIGSHILFDFYWYIHINSSNIYILGFSKNYVSANQWQEGQGVGSKHRQERKTYYSIATIISVAQVYFTRTLETQVYSLLQRLCHLYEPFDFSCEFEAEGTDQFLW